jgi:hypothetical protein
MSLFPGRPGRTGRRLWLALLLTVAATIGSVGLPATPANAAQAAHYLSLPPGLHGTFHVQFAHSDQCLHIPGQEPWRGRWLVQWPCDTTSSSRSRQFWEIRVANSGTDFALRSPLTGLCANIDHANYDFGTPIILWDCASPSGVPYPNNFFKAGWDTVTSPPADYFWFVPSQSTGWALNVNGASTAAGAHVILWNLQKQQANEWIRWF